MKFINKKLLIIVTVFILLIVISQAVTIGLLIYKPGTKPVIPQALANSIEHKKVYNVNANVIGRGKLTFYPYEGYANKFKNLEISLSKIDGIEIAPGETFSFNQVTGLLNKDVETVYYPGFNILNHLTPAGGVCSAAVLIATAAKNASLQFKDLENNNADGPVAHRDWMSLYHRTFDIDGHMVDTVDATVATEFDSEGKSYSLNDVKFVNNTSKRIVINVGKDWDDSTSDNKFYPFQKNQTTVSMTVRISTFE